MAVESARNSDGLGVGRVGLGGEGRGWSPRGALIKLNV